MSTNTVTPATATATATATDELIEVQPRAFLECLYSKVALDLTGRFEPNGNLSWSSALKEEAPPCPW